MAREHEIRRPRCGKRDPRGEYVHFREADDVRLSALHHHGDLSNLYLFEFVERYYNNYEAARKRMARVFHETGFYEKANAQENTATARSNFLIYGISKKGEEHLKSKGLYSKFSPNMTEIWHHDFNCSQTTASLELAVPEGFIYEPQHVVLTRNETHLNFPIDFIEPKILSRKNIQVLKKTITVSLKPDRVGQLNYPDGKRLLMFIEVENSKKQHQYRRGYKTTERNAIQYRKFLGSKRLYRNYFPDRKGLGAIVLYLYWDYGTMQGAMDYVASMTQNGMNAYSLFKYVPEFSKWGFKPAPVLHSLYTEPWVRIGYPPTRLTDL